MLRTSQQVEASSINLKTPKADWTDFLFRVRFRGFL